MTHLQDSTKPDAADQAPPAADSQQRPPRSLPEKITFAAASTILAIVAGLVGAVWINPQTQTPPDVVLRQSAATRTVGDRFYVPFEVKNQGGETAESVQVLAELEVQGKVVESGEQQVDFLSGGETESGAFVFTQNPQQGQVVLRVGSYKSP